MKVTRINDYFTQNVTITVIAVIAIIYALKVKSEAGKIIAGSMALLTVYRWFALEDQWPTFHHDEGYEGTVHWYTKDERGYPMTLYPGESAVAELVDTNEAMENPTFINSGTNAYIDAAGKVKTYSPISRIWNNYTNDRL